MFNRKILIAALVSLSASSAFAEESQLSYTYLGLGYEKGDVADIDADGFNFNGSAALSDSFYLVGSHYSLRADERFEGEDVDITQLSIGVGFHAPISSTVDFATDISYAKAELEVGGFSSDGNGYLVSAGVRAKPSDKVELGALLNYTKIEDEKESGYSVSARYFVDTKISLGLGYGSTNDINTISFNARFDL